MIINSNIIRRGFTIRLKVSNPIVDINGDEMSQVMWGLIKEKVSFEMILEWLNTNYIAYTSVSWFKLTKVWSKCFKSRFNKQ